LERTYGKLSPWQKAQVARHPDRPHVVDYVDRLIDDWTPLAGDRAFADDAAIVGGLGRFRGRSIVLIGQEKGADTEDRIRHNFGMARPEGYRKAMRLMRLADRFGLPVVTLVDTPGAFPGIGAEERNQSEAIGRNLFEMAALRVPIVTTIIGEGGSGGALAIAVGDITLMLQYSVYSVISPEGCAAILWRSADQAPAAAEALKLTAQDLLAQGIIDSIIEEPLGGAQRARTTTIDRVGDAIEAQLRELAPLTAQERRRERRAKFLQMGRPAEATA
jgi:acetyl-CoA carboxylase carboxyl transferase subunit alpha